ncbi:MAG: RnfABCDGE type electron transport complex subunit D [Firmicutes bacterium]|nr:RnfABCDGE type electron transport complex subunit D [Bacillota bacterium]
MNKRNLIVSSAPHVVSPVNTSRIMLDVIIALVPAVAMATFVFGMRALLLTAVCAASCVFFEYAVEKILKRDVTIGDMSAAVTGVILSLNLPANLPFWMACVGSFIAIVLVKQLFGGMGQNFANPAITARVALFIGFATAMTNFPLPVAQQTADAITGATPLALFAKGLEVPSNGAMFFGTIGGSMGETSALALLIGGAYLLFKKVIEPTIPACFIGTVAVMALLTGNDPIFHVCAGGVMLGAIFMATDYVTSPITTKGKVIFGVGCGLLTMIIRLYASYPEGVSFAILIMNILTPHIDNLTIPALNGVPKEKKAKGGDK